VKRIVVALMVVAGGMLSACNNEEQVGNSGRAGLAGTYDLARVGDLLFVTSTDRNELRVLELAEQPKDRGFLRAPNPFQALAIPVLARPQALARDVRYVDGAEVAGPYVYVRSNGATKVSLVAAGREHLRELTRLDTSALAGSQGPVTAFAARGPEEEGGSSTLYYATQEQGGARLWRLRVPAPQALSQGAAMPAPEPLALALPEGESVISLLMLPEPGWFALSTRGAAGSSGSSFKVDEHSLAMMPLHFGAPVLQLSTHPRVGDTLAAGERIFGLLEPAFCGAQPPCTGVLAVDSATGTVSQASFRDPEDPTGPELPRYPMVTIGASPGLPMGVTLAVDSDLLFPRDGGREVRKFPLLGIVTLSSGEILFFDALTLRAMDINKARAEAPVAAYNAVGGARQVPDLKSIITAEVTDGVTRNTHYRLLYQGILPGLSGLQRDPTSASRRFEVPAVPHGIPIEQLVRPGDVIVLHPEGTGTVCTTDVEVNAVEPPVAPGQPAVLVTDSALPAACATFPRFLVRASGEAPLVLFSGTGEYLRRMGEGDTYEVRGPYYFLPEDYTGAQEGLAVRISITGPIPRPPVERGDMFVVSSQSNFFPFAITMDAQLARYRLPGSVVHARLGDKDRAFISYPSANGILQVDLESVLADAPNFRAVTPFE
jgi:hypothetical protein